MGRDLHEAHRRFSMAEAVEVVTLWVDWPEYESFTRNLVSLSKLLDSSTIDTKLRVERDGCWALRRALQSTPLHPSEYIGDSTLVGVTLYAGEIGNAVEKLRESVVVLLASKNPMRYELEQALSGGSTVNIESAQTVKILTPKKFVSLVNDVMLNKHISDRSIKATSPIEAKLSDHSDVVFAFGALENHANFFKNPHERSREIAWILNAPASFKIVLFQLADCPPFDVSKYEIWKNTNQFVPKTLGVQPSSFIEGFEPTIRVDPINPTAVVPGDPVVEAVVVHLFNGHYVYFSDAVPPKPTCIRNGELEVEIDDGVNPSTLQPGDVLLIRTGPASHSFLRSHAVDWLERECGKSEVKQMIEIVDNYKNALKLKYGNAGFAQMLVADGMEEHYVRNQIVRAFVDSTIATQRAANFIQIAKALGFDYGEDEWSVITKIQTAHRQAGRAAVQELREIVIADESWQDVVNEPGIAKLRAGSVGELVLIPVVQKPDQKVRVSVGSIGLLQRNLKLFHE